MIARKSGFTMTSDRAQYGLYFRKQKIHCGIIKIKRDFVILMRNAGQEMRPET